ncbi:MULTISPECIES: DUF4439 domain-containing protein [unclassified Corynebacterium]|uniref:DUF4439 domain-containing protein n=1 Tax=unclassified Corynebacterium TaxID=2624378 RepID=UPI00264D42B7|nr:MULTISPECIES: DUF4439 domain-containing protein [unclassified Corynebacterium]MDN8593731.1 DUF4439 domain-containing protein [Corynebacterium sp. P4_F2]WKK55845.1 DUF4439 domain-containing protein [Corynebacterium sp. P4-C1]WKK63253.1 DUF4439 domain-containing protein [Corynebacterium sp. P8-C1]
MKSSRKFLAVILTTALAAPLAACSPLDVFGPRANSEIIALAKQASADAEASSPNSGGGDSNAKWNELRIFHAKQLQDEAQRLCGTDDNGETPSTCQVEYDGTHLPVGADAAALVEQTVESTGKVPDESVDLVVAQAIDAAAAADLPLDIASPIDDEAALEAAKQLASAEYAVDYGLDIATAYADDQLQGRIDTLRTLHDARLSALHDAFPAGSLPVREAGYEVHGGAPTNPAEAAAFVDKLESDLVERWRNAAADATSTDWRGAAIILAGHAQRAADAGTA